MKRIVPFLFIVISFFYSCQKKEVNVDPGTTNTSGTTTTTTTGNIIGTINPAGAATNVFVVDAANVFTSQVVPDANGSFKLSGLPAGTYSLYCTVALGYTPTTGILVKVAAGQTINAGTFVISPAVGSITGTVFPANAAANIVATNKATKVSYAIVPDLSSGAFKFDNVVPGNYNLSFTAASPSIAPADTVITVTGNQTTGLGFLIFKTPNITGSIIGTIVPAGSAAVQVSNSATGFSVFAYPDKVTGKYVFPVLPPGTYTVRFSTDDTHKSPGNLSVTLSPGQNLDLGTTNIPLYLHAISCSINGTAFIGVTVVSCSYNAPKLTFGASNSGALDGSITTLTINLDNVNGPGTYTVQGTSTSSITYNTGQLGVNRWSSNNGGSGTIIITAVDPVLRVITGTYTATLTPVVNASGNLAITNGMFNLTY